MAVFPFNLKYSAVIVMVAALVAGLVFALAHDAFYQSLNGKPILKAQPLAGLTSSFNISDQQVYLSLGTLFAFLVKSFLGASVSTVFDQFVWKSIHGQRTKIGIIDDLLLVLKNGFTVLNLQLWKRSPISMTLALICWLLPTTSIISTATLSVHLTSFNEYVMKRTPRVDFTSANFGVLTSGVYVNTTPSKWATAYMGPSSETESIVSSVATQGTILQIEPPAANSSWSVEFYGPMIVCDNVNQTLANHITQDVVLAINASKVITNDTQELVRYSYLSWAPESDTLNGSTPFYHANGSDTYTQRSLGLGPLVQSPDDLSRVWGPEKPGVDGPPLSLFVATFPRALEYTKFQQVIKNMDRAVQNATIVHCALHNASYQVDLTYVNRDQTIHARDITVLNGVSHFGGVTNVDFKEGKASSDTSFLHNPYLMESLSYQSIMEAFGRLLFGSVSNEIHVIKSAQSNQNGIISGTNNLNTSILTTSLKNTEEIRFIQSIISPGPKSPFEDYWDGRSVRASNESSPVLSKALEELFRNITFSLMSSNMFQPNYTVDAVPDTNVTITSYHNIYVYTRPILWAAYGTALSVTTLCVVAGILLYLSSDGSYTSKFSTILRVTRGAVISTELDTKDYSGLDPLPVHIANAKLTTGYNPDHPDKASSTDSLRHRESAASSQLLQTRSDKVVNESNEEK
ncbi:uncharacterized protein N7487_008909 [Penicillium crustosum]|uniref:uncharacterized protein n=1 Tax=Penicillium crustosum TaxID=36656 RepID=UPI00239BFBBD|nr:uncharacterized protein N7487_008909 [Penicillium crustosum]KAJ5403013.1 hypothetical protein N7487_008909 [Penicillium crustosum]